jgi:hypothetical protein
LRGGRSLERKGEELSASNTTILAGGTFLFGETCPKEQIALLYIVKRLARCLLCDLVCRLNAEAVGSTR